MDIAAILAQLQTYPAWLWVGLFGTTSLFGALGSLATLIISNRHSRKTQRTQNEHSEQVQRIANESTAQLQRLSESHDATQRDRERLMQLRRDIYIPAHDAILGLSVVLGKLSNLELPENAIAAEYSQHAMTISRLLMIGSKSLVLAVSALQREINGLFGELFSSRYSMTMTRIDRDIAMSAYQSHASEVTRFIEMLKQFNLDLKTDKRQWDAIQRQLDIAIRDRDKASRERLVFDTKLLTLQLALLDDLMSGLEKIQHLWSPALTSVRNELETEDVSDVIEAQIQANFSSLKLSMASVVTKIKSQLTGYERELSEELPPPAERGLPQYPDANIQEITFSRISYLSLAPDLLEFTHKLSFLNNEICLFRRVLGAIISSRPDDGPAYRYWQFHALTGTSALSSRIAAVFDLVGGRFGSTQDALDRLSLDAIPAHVREVIKLMTTDSPSASAIRKGANFSDSGTVEHSQLEAMYASSDNNDLSIYYGHLDANIFHAFSFEALAASLRVALGVGSSQEAIDELLVHINKLLPAVTLIVEWSVTTMVFPVARPTPPQGHALSNLDVGLSNVQFFPAVLIPEKQQPNPAATASGTPNY